MRAVNTSTQPVELDEVNGAGLLFPHVEGETGHERDLTEVTDREKALAEAGLIALVDPKKTGRAPEKGGDA